MKTIFLTIAMLASCSTDSGYFDPTGTWAMTFQYGAGVPNDCQITGNQPNGLVVSKISSGQLVLTPTTAGLTAGGGIALTETDATLNATIQDSDPFDIGSGTEVETHSFSAYAAEASFITGQGQTRIQGPPDGINCVSTFAIIGELQ